jgi:probable HAF family extracellular repeat protein
VVVGYADDANGTTRPFRWTSVGGMAALPIPDEYFYSFAVGINSNGDVVGTGYTTPDNVNYFTHAFLWPAGGGDPVNLGTLQGGSYSAAAGINDAGQVAGVADDANGDRRVFLWSQATGMLDLGVPPGGYTQVEVTAINNLGQLTGFAAATSNDEEHAFGWFPTGPGGQGQFFVLGDFGGEQGELFGNNDKGQLVGYANNPELSGADRLQGFLLTPKDATPPTTTATPTGTAGNGGWFRSDVTVNLNAIDTGGFGVARITYSATGAQTIPTTNLPGAATSFTITTEGETTITFFATDNAGNVEVAKTLTVRIDKTGPVLTTTLAPSTARPGDTVAITIASNESLAAPPTLTATGPCIAPTTLTMSAGATPNTYTSSYLVPTGTTGCTITFSASGADPAGNPSTGGTATLRVGKFRTAIAAVSGSATYGDATATLTATLTRIDGGGGPVANATITFRFGGVDYPATTNANGVARISVPLGSRNAGTYPGAVQATFAGDANLEGSSAAGPLVVGRRILWVKPTDRTVGLKQPNPPTTPPAGCLASQTPTSACWLDLARGSTLAPGDDWADLNLSQLRFSYNRNPPATNASEYVGKTYRITAFGVVSGNYDVRYDPGTLTVK